MAETFFKPSVGGKDVSVVTSTNAVVDPELGATLSEMTTEINVSKLYPTGGVGGTNKYTLEGAIAKIPTKLRTVGIKCSFLDEAGKLVTYSSEGVFTDVKSWSKSPTNESVWSAKEASIDATNMLSAAVGVDASIVDNNRFGAMWNGSSVAYSDGRFDSFLIGIKGSRLSWNKDIAGIATLVTFTKIPTIGLKEHSRIIPNTGSFTSEDEEKYMLVTVDTTKISSFAYNIEYDNSMIKKLRNGALVYNPANPYESGHGLVDKPSNIFRKGDSAYEYYYAMYDVKEGDRLRVSGFSVNPVYACAKAGIKGSDKVITLLNGTGQIHSESIVVIPAGYNTLYVNRKDSAPVVESEGFGLNTIVHDNSKKIKEIERVISSPTTKDVKEENSQISQDDINMLCEKGRNLRNTNANVSVVSFIYDDYYSEELLSLFNERNLKVSFAEIAHINKNDSGWRNRALAIRRACVDGHGSIAHGTAMGAGVKDGLGIDKMCDKDAHAAIKAENKAFDDFKLSHRGLVEFNTWADTPHTWKIVGSYYDYLVGFGEPINMPGKTSLYGLGRFNTDNASMLPDAKGYVDKAVKTDNCLLIFGGHYPSRTGSGSGNYSSKEDFVALLDYVKKMVDAGLLISLNIDDAVSRVWGKNGIALAHDYRYENPRLGELKVDGGIKYCSREGTRAVYTIKISGTTQNGNFTLKIGSTDKSSLTDKAQAIVINVLSTDSVQSVIDKINKQIFHAYTIVQKSANELTLYRDITGETFTPIITDNTSGLIFNIEQNEKGTEATWM